MTYLLAILAFGVFFLLMAIGVIFTKEKLRKSLPAACLSADRARQGCSMGPECFCKKDDGSLPEDCDNLTE